jgi:3-hydroxyisobutyrate dehydrogenase-like beta-hydroxyacid dehydrogenase
MRIAFLGLGNMGEAMARNLICARHELMLYNRTRSRAENLATEGATVAGSPARAAAGSDIAITMLADDAAVESVVLGDGGLVESLPKDGLHISMSTISPALSQRLTSAHRDRGQVFIAAPVFGRPEAAAAAKLFVVAAGEREALSRAKPLFDVIGQRTFEVGERPEMANYIKLLGNFMIVCVVESLGEVFAVARKAAIDPSMVLDVLTGTLFGAPVFKTYGSRIVAEEFSPAGFRLPLGLKDVRLALQAAEAVNAPMPFANIVRDRFITAIANGYEDLDWSAIALMAAEDAGLSRTTTITRDTVA